MGQTHTQRDTLLGQLTQRNKDKHQDEGRNRIDRLKAGKGKQVRSIGTCFAPTWLLSDTLHRIMIIIT